MFPGLSPESRRRASQYRRATRAMGRTPSRSVANSFSPSRGTANKVPKKGLRTWKWVALTGTNGEWPAVQRLIAMFEARLWQPKPWPAGGVPRVVAA